jgi:hypothetical protein
MTTASYLDPVQPKIPLIQLTSTHSCGTLILILGILQTLSSILVPPTKIQRMLISLLILPSNFYVGLLANTDHVIPGFHTAYIAHDAISPVPEMTALQWLRHEISHHALCWTSLDANLLHTHSIGDKEVSYVDMPCALAAQNVSISF